MIGVLYATIRPVQERHFQCKCPTAFTPESAVFDEDNLVSCAGLVPVMTLAEQAGLSKLLANKIHIAAPRIKSGSANPAPKLATLIASMCAGADYIDDVDLVRAGGMKALFERVYAPSTVGTLLREFTFGHARQLESVLGEHLAGLCERVDCCPAPDERAFVDIDSLVRPVYGHAQTGRILRAHQDRWEAGLAQRTLTVWSPRSAPHRRARDHRRSGYVPGKPTPVRVRPAWSPRRSATARAAGVSGLIIVRGDSAYGNRR